jgi:monofunctional biosynthetic peptidoglycan transglycosylase
VANGRPGSRAQTASSGRRRIPTKTSARSASPPRWRRRLAWIAAATLLVFALASLALWFSLPDVSRLKAENPKTTAFIELRKNQSGSKLKVRWTWRPLKKISPFLRSAVVHAEDGKFWSHGGVDWDALETAARRDIAERKLAAGGSTITQQLAKNLYLSPSRSPIRKLRELMITRLLERLLTKRRILELYLNVIEWGDGVWGAEAASRRYFRKPAAQLSSSEAALLAGAIINPVRYSPANPPRRLRSRQQMILRRMGSSAAPRPPADGPPSG